MTTIRGLIFLTVAVLFSVVLFLEWIWKVPNDTWGIAAFLDGMLYGWSALMMIGFKGKRD